MTEQQTARRFPVLAIIAFGMVAVLLLTLAILSAVKGVRTAAADGNVVRVQDGQTVVVNKDGAEEVITLAGVMAPRPAPDGQDPTLENCLADEATQSLADFLAPGDAVRMEYPDESAGPNGTRLAVIHHDGEITSIRQVEAGLAAPLRDQPMEQLGNDLKTAQKTARTEEAGLYSPAEPCTLAARIAPAVNVLREMPTDRPTTAEDADAQIATVEDAVEQGITAEKVFATVEPEGNSLASLAWGQDLPRLQERLTGALSSAQSELAALQSTRNVLLTREREEAARILEEARLEAIRQAEAKAEAERKAAAAQAEREAAANKAKAEAEEAAKKKAAEEKAKAEEEAKKKAEEEAKKKAEEEAKKKAEESASAAPEPPADSSSPRPGRGSGGPPGAGGDR